MFRLNQLKSCDDLCDRVNDIGFIPLFACSIKGFSVEECTPLSDWWSGDGSTDPWEWRKVIAGNGEIAYGKLFEQKAAFVSHEWYPVLARYRRKGYDFESLYEAGLASRKAKSVMDVLSSHPTLASYEIKRLAGFGKEGEKGFEGVLTALQMQTYITIRGFERKLNKLGQEYGWSTSLYSTAENLFGEDHLDSCALEPGDAKEALIERVMAFIPGVSRTEAEKFIK